MRLEPLLLLQLQACGHQSGQLQQDTTRITTALDVGARTQMSFILFGIAQLVSTQVQSSWL